MARRAYIRLTYPRAARSVNARSVNARSVNPRSVDPSERRPRTEYGRLAMGVHELRSLTRPQLIDRATSLGVERAGVLTQAELLDEIVTRTTPLSGRALVRGWLGKARDLVTQVVSKGLHLPSAARVLRALPLETRLAPPPPPLPTVTLAEIYAAQGHVAKAVTILDQVLVREPRHELAAQLRERLAAQLGGVIVVPPVPEEPVYEEESEELEVAAVAATTSVPASEDATVAAMTATTSVPASEALDVAAMTATTSVPASEDTTVASQPWLDEVVVLATDPRTIYVYWELRPLRYARILHERPSGRLVLRVVTFSVHPEGPVRVANDVEIEGVTGDVFVGGLTPASALRTSIGWRTEADFTVLAAGAELDLPPYYFAASEAGERVDWRTLAMAPSGASEARAADRPAGAKHRLEGYLSHVQNPLPVHWVELAPGLEPPRARRHDEQLGSARAALIECVHGASEAYRAAGDAYAASVRLGVCGSASESSRA
ncbi:MAG: DUF4912 domain-containing protein [Myxococcales bacterium]|nr:DUF4912 domain-containing protein [Myxococcales bacterium]